MFYYNSAFPSKALRIYLLEQSKVGFYAFYFLFFPHLDPNISRSSPALSNEISVTGAQTQHVISAAQGRERSPQ